MVPICRISLLGLSFGLAFHQNRPVLSFKVGVQPLRRKQSNHPATRLSATSVRSFFQFFNEQVEQRCLAVQNHPASHTNSSDIMVDWEVLLAMDRSKQTAATRQQHPLMIHLEATGGACIVRFSDPNQIKIVERLWDALATIYQTQRSGPAFCHQTLSWSANESSSVVNDPPSGYRYIHYPPIQEQSNRQLRDIVGTESHDNIEEAFRLMCSVGTTFSSVVCDAFCLAPKSNKVYLKSFLDDHRESAPYSGSFMRLSQYTTSDKIDYQSLRPHCDWSFVTIVPVSSVPGLELYLPLENSWVCPEALVHEQMKNNQEERAQHVVVLSGKWLEILTNGQIKSTIHRVITHKGQTARLSIPLFLRPVANASNALEELEFDNATHFDSMRLRLADFILNDLSVRT